MAIFKPETTSTTTTPKSSYLGAIEVGPVGFKDRSGDFPGQDWATIDKKWEDENGNQITNIAEHLSSNFKMDGQDFIAYAYKKKPKKPGDKVYTEMWPKLWLNTEGGRMQCDKDVKWLKKNGYLKEATQDDLAPKGQTNLADNALANL